MKIRWLILMLLITSRSWGSQQTPREQAEQMAESACLFQYEVINSRFTLGFSEEKSVQTSSVILTDYLQKNKEVAGEPFFSLLRSNIIAQLRELEVNKEAVQQLKSPPPDFKDKFLSSCNKMKKEQLEAMHVFG